MGTLLCVGLYPYDVVHLLVVAREAQRQLGLEPVFLDVDIAPPGVAEASRELVTASGFRTITARLIAEDDGLARNRIDRVRRQRAATCDLIDKVLDDVQPAVILAGINPPPGFFLDRAAARGVPTVLVQLFHWGDRAFYRGFHADDRRLEDEGLSTLRRLKRRLRRRIDAKGVFAPHIAWDLSDATVAAQGPGMAQRLVSDGVPRDHVVVTGNPSLDDLYALRTSTELAGQQLRQQLGLAPDVRIVSNMRGHEARLVGLSTDTMRDGQVQTIRAVQAAAPDAQVIVKLHPKEEAADKAFVMSIDPTVLVVGDEVDTNQLLAASDVVVGTLSTTLLYSVLLDRPTVSALLWPGLDYFRSSTDWSGVQRVTTPEALTDSVHQHLNDPAHQQVWRERRAAFVADEFAFDGRGTERLVDLLSRLLSKASVAVAPRS